MQTLWDGQINGQLYSLSVDDSGEIPSFTLTQIAEEGVITQIAKRAWGFAKAHPFLTGWAALLAVDSIKKYIQAERQAIRLYSNNPGDRGKYQEMIKEMKKQGYYVASERFIPGSGYEWILKRGRQ